MKDIKDYFKNSSNNSDTSFSKTSHKNVDPNTKSTENTDHENIASPSESNENLGKKSKRIERKKKSKKITKKENFDDETITKPISKALRTPKNDKTYQSNVAIKDLKEKNLSEKVFHELGISPDEVKSSIKMENLPQIETSDHSGVNAFQFLMKSRNKIIGTNSPGKELIEKEGSISEEHHEKLSVRKKLLQNWADSKVNRKRKLDDEEIDKCIKVKLEMRKKRFKELLNVKSIDTKNMDSEVEVSVIPMVESNRKRQSSLTSYGITSVDSSLNEVILKRDEDQKGSLPLSKTEVIDLSNISRNTKKNLNEIQTKKHLRKQVLSCGDDSKDGKNDDNSIDSHFIKGKKHKHKHKKKMRDSIVWNKKPIIKPLKHWKMRIKLSDEGQMFNVAGGNMEVNKSDELINRVVDSDNQVTIIDDYVLGENQTIDEIELVIDSDEVSNADDHSVRSRRKIRCGESPMKNKKVRNDTKSTESKSVPILLENDDFKRVLRNRASLQKPKMDQFEEFSSNESSNDSFDVKIKEKKPLKVAPVFVKAIPKPKIDMKLIEAKKKFLLSEMPDVLRKTIEKKECIRIPEFDVFPKISHILQINPEESLLNLRSIKLPLRIDDTFECKCEKIFCKSLISHSSIEKLRYSKSEPIKNVKTIIRNMKLEHTDYPVYKSYRLLKKIGDDLNIVGTKNKTNKHNKAKKTAEKSGNNSASPIEHLMWTEKYKPNCSEDTIGNFQAVSTLKKWLESWHEAFKSGKKKCQTKIYSSDSESDFISSDAESLLGGSSLSTTIILTGPCGSGKSSSVYGICNELGLNVIELNASNRRTGKQVLQELQEATQSHQVRKNKDSILSLTKKKKNREPKNEKEKQSAKKMCVLLIEDVDIVFEQDEGFINAISQISSITKRPIILTTSNEKSIYSQKFINDFKSVKFHSLTAMNMGIWLQVLCLLEGQYVDISSIGELLEYNNGDIRKTLLELQFWIQSGGQISKHNTFVDGVFQIESPNEELCLMQTDDDASNISLKKQEGIVDDFRTHSNIISDFEIFQFDRFYDVPVNFDLVKIWWNIPTFLNIESDHGNSFNPRKKSKRNKKKLRIISDMFDSLAWCDISYRKVSFKCDVPVCPRESSDYLEDSLEIGEVFEEYSSNSDFLFEWNHYMVNRCVNQSKNRFAKHTTNSQRLMNMAVPSLKHKSKLAKSREYEEELSTPVPLTGLLDRKSVSMDYLPVLRDIARSEKNRAQNTMKRHNRFHNYLQNLNIKCNNSVLSFATHSLLVNR